MVVLSLLEYYGIEWSPLQIRETAEMMFTEFYWLQIAELKHFILKAKMGEAGKMFAGRAFLPVNLMEWLKNYAQESLWIREGRYISDSLEERYDERWASKGKREATEADPIYMQEKIKQMQRDVQRNQSDNAKTGTNG